MFIQVCYTFFNFLLNFSHFGQVYQVGEGGIVKVDSENEVNQNKTIQHNTVLRILPDSFAQQMPKQTSIAKTNIDPGQSSSEDADLYTTRS